MAECASPKDIAELIQFISSCVREQFEKTGGRTTGAALAAAIRKQFPGMSYEQLGLSRLADAVRRAEEAGKLVRHRDVKHLEVSPTTATPRSPSTPIASASSYVRPDVWRSFVFISDRYAQFLDRTTGRLIVLLSNNTSEIRAHTGNPQFAQINPIAPETQKDWMQQFVMSQESLNVDDAPINEDQWWIAFPAWLQEQNTANIIAWRRFRAEKVVTFIREWAKENGILLNSLFSPPRLPVPTSTRRLDRPVEDEATRRVIIAAIEDMPFEQLQDLAIPVRYMLRHFRPR